MSTWITGSVEVAEFEAFTRETVKALQSPREKRDFLRAYALRFIELVVPRTPVDKGRARAGWTAARLPGVNAIRIGGSDQNQVRKGKREGSYSEKGLNNPNTDQWLIEIFNGVPYITFLELGSSSQAPSGAVRISLRELVSVMTKGEARRAEAAIRLANRRARLATGLRQGGPTRNPLGRANIGRR